MFCHCAFFAAVGYAARPLRYFALKEVLMRKKKKSGRIKKRLAWQETQILTLPSLPCGNCPASSAGNACAEVDFCQKIEDFAKKRSGK